MFEEIIIDDLTSYDDLTYNDYADDYIELIHKEISVGNVEVFTDTSHEERKGAEAEYIVINNEIVYLKDLKQHR
jgi:hypothetical protein